jgi:hypothetical protein
MGEIFSVFLTLLLIVLAWIIFSLVVVWVFMAVIDWVDEKNGRTPKGNRTNKK